MKKYLKALLFLVLSMSLVYLACSFVLMELDVTVWSDVSRLVCVSLSLLSFGGYYITVFVED